MPVPTFDDDTSPDALRTQYAALRRMSVAQRLAMMDQLTAMARAMTRAGLRHRHPGASETELDDCFADLVLGGKLAAEVRAHRRARGTSEAS